MNRLLRSIIFALIVAPFLTQCGTTASNALTSATDGIKNSPDVNPSNLDSATGTSSIAKSVAPFTHMDNSRAVLDIEVVSTPVTNGVDYTMKQCASNSQSHFVNIVATNDSGKVKYVKTETLKSGFSGQMNISSTVYTTTAGAPSGSRSTTIRSNTPYDFYATFSSDGTTNTFAGTNGSSHVIGAWNATLGCAKIGTGGTNVPFTMTVLSTGERTCAAATDESLCSSLPTMQTTVPAFADFTGSQVYNCQAASGCTAVTPTSASGLEDAGGAFCTSLSGSMAHWNTASTTVSCGTTTTAAGVCACLWPFYAAASAKVKSSSRSGECKVKGLVNNGSFDLGADLSTTKNICIQDLTIS